MERARLERTITVLENVAANEKQEFKMSVWLGSHVIHTCKTAACAFGYAALDPELQCEGLYLGVVYSDKEGSDHMFTFTRLEDYRDFANKNYAMLTNMGPPTPMFHELVGFAAAEKFYGITPKASTYLFDPSSYDDPETVKPEDVVKRISRVMELAGDAPPRDDWFCEDV